VSKAEATCVVQTVGCLPGESRDLLLCRAEVIKQKQYLTNRYWSVWRTNRARASAGVAPLQILPRAIGCFRSLWAVPNTLIGDADWVVLRQPESEIKLLI
jgi:hypothetical protein